MSEGSSGQWTADSLSDDAGVEVAEDLVLRILAVEEVAREWKEAAETESGGHPLVRRTCAEHFLAERTPRCETLVRVHDLTKGLPTDGIRVVALRILA